VTITADTGATCTAVTNIDGVATCKPKKSKDNGQNNNGQNNDGQQGIRLTAAFAGAENAEFVDLPSESTAIVKECNGQCGNQH
jgi:hypothetical protein